MIVHRCAPQIRISGHPPQFSRARAAHSDITDNLRGCDIFLTLASMEVSYVRVCLCFLEGCVGRTLGEKGRGVYIYTIDIHGSSASPTCLNNAVTAYNNAGLSFVYSEPSVVNHRTREKFGKQVIRGPHLDVYQALYHATPYSNMNSVHCSLPTCGSCGVNKKTYVRLYAILSPPQVGTSITEHSSACQQARTYHVVTFPRHRSYDVKTSPVGHSIQYGIQHPRITASQPPHSSPHATPLTRALRFSRTWHKFLNYTQRGQ